MLASVGNRLAGKMKDLGVVQQASATILELGAALDAQLLKEQRPTERMRMLRETTNRIVRTANDAAQAYSRASRAITAELERPNTNPAPAQAMRLRGGPAAVSAPRGGGIDRHTGHAWCLTRTDRNGFASCATAGERMSRTMKSRTPRTATQTTRCADRGHWVRPIASEPRLPTISKRDVRQTRWNARSSEPTRVGDRSTTTPADQNRS